MSTNIGTVGATNPGTARRAQKRGSSLAQREAFWGYLFISPWIIGFLIFTALPTLATVAMTFTDIKLDTRSFNFVGAQNYVNMFNDSQVWHSLRVTLSYGLLALPVALFLPLLLALLMNNRNLAGKNFFRASFYSRTSSLSSPPFWFGPPC